MEQSCFFWNPGQTENQMEEEMETYPWDSNLGGKLNDLEDSDTTLNPKH